MEDDNDGEVVDIDLDDERLDAEQDGNYDDDDELAVATAAAAAEARRPADVKIALEADEDDEDEEDDDEDTTKKKKKKQKQKKKEPSIKKPKAKPRKMVEVRKALKAAKKQEQASAPKMDDRIVSLERRITLLETENRELKSYKRKHSHCFEEDAIAKPRAPARMSLLMQQPHKAK